MNSFAFFLFPAATLSYGWQITAGSVFGIIFGTLLVKCGFCDREKIRAMLKFADRDLVAVILGALFFGLIFRWAACRWNILPENSGFSGGMLANSIVGGSLCGLGLYIGGFTPLSALAGLGCGKLQTLWAIIGMLIALPVLQWCNDKFAVNSNAWNKALPVGKVTWNFFDSGNPALYGVIALALLLIVIAWRRN